MSFIHPSYGRAPMLNDPFKWLGQPAENHTPLDPVLLNSPPSDQKDLGVFTIWHPKPPGGSGYGRRGPHPLLGGHPKNRR